MIKQIKHLHGIGFAVHWVRPRSKAPVRSGWTQGERASWASLIDDFQKGMNVGVRLGRASSFGDSYLAAIDCDVKSSSQQHLKEMESALKALLKGNAPTVTSGRGNGSKHLYIRTPEPIKPYRFAQSKEIVKVKMKTGDRPSKREIEKLTGNELAEGYRLRPAWEISVMGEGQQVVLPPSIHPDSGKPYAWATPPPQSSKDLPLIDLDRPETDDATDVEKSVDFVEADVSLGDLKLRLKPEIYEMIRTGEGCDDRSAGLFKASIALVRLGLPDNEILTVLTDRDNYLGEAAFHHAKTRSRAKAARWLYRYTLHKVKKEYSAAEAFKAEVVETYLDEREAKKQRAGLAVSLKTDWTRKLARVNGQDKAPPKAILKNVYLILRHAVGENAFKRDEFANAERHGCVNPWGSAVNSEVRDIDVLNIRKWLIDFWRCDAHTSMINEAVAIIGYENRYHPVREYLAGLEWDGRERINTWLRDYLGAEGPELYLEAVSRKVLVAMCARVMEPGVKFDHVLILEGKQGKGKSTAVSILAEPWFTDAALDPNDKDSVVNMRNVWVVEMGELSGMRHADIETWKAFAVRRVDRIRMPYGHRAEDFPRQCIFVGTTNSKEYLKDTTGNRRFWPVTVNATNFAALRRDRDQLLAEAFFTYGLGENLWLSKDEESQAKGEQAARTFVDEWVGILGDFFDKNASTFPDDFALIELFEGVGPLVGNRADRAYQMRAGEALRALGFERHRKRVKGENPRWMWRKIEK